MATGVAVTAAFRAKGIGSSSELASLQSFPSSGGVQNRKTRIRIGGQKRKDIRSFTMAPISPRKVIRVEC